MSHELIAWIKAVAAVGAIVTLILALIAYVRLRSSWSKRPHSFMAHLLFIEKTKEFYYVFILIVIAVILGNVAVRL